MFKSIFSDNFLCYFKGHPIINLLPKRIKLKLLSKLLFLNSNFALTVSYISSAWTTRPWFTLAYISGFFILRSSSIICFLLQHHFPTAAEHNYNITALHSNCAKYCEKGLINNLTFGLADNESNERTFLRSLGISCWSPKWKKTNLSDIIMTWARNQWKLDSWYHRALP